MPTGPIKSEGYWKLHRGPPFHFLGTVWVRFGYGFTPYRPNAPSDLQDALSNDFPRARKRTTIDPCLLPIGA